MKFTDSIPWSSCFLLLTCTSPFLSLLYILSLHPILQILQMWAHLSLTLVSHTHTHSTPPWIYWQASHSFFLSNSAGPWGLMTLTGEVTVLLKGLGVTVRQTIGQSWILERVAAGQPPSPTGREGMTLVSDLIDYWHKLTELSGVPQVTEETGAAGFCGQGQAGN